MAPAVTLDWSEPCQHWRYPKFCPAGQQKHERAKSAMELSSKEANTAYKKFCKFLRRLKNKKRKSLLRAVGSSDDGCCCSGNLGWRSIRVPALRKISFVYCVLGCRRYILKVLILFRFLFFCNENDNVTGCSKMLEKTFLYIFTFICAWSDLRIC
ncbi:hypothetical protein WH47_09015 [Habropoda laboriosa]|uniref:Uncharacterized protein n=1 Tax=Habropoda laboriosa TaxID=597456 RepID=A0A0L7QP12_9HYME|nr:hypothetical protein WH47_09015 [Habropoda laboriosa]